MFTLQDFIRFTKGWEYVIAIVAVFVFMAFWRVLAGKPLPDGQHEKERVSVGGPQLEEDSIGEPRFREERVSIGATHRH